MTTPSSYKTSSDYISELQFDHIETYSFQRGPEFEAEMEKNRGEYMKLRDRQKKQKLNPDEEAELKRLFNPSDRQNMIYESGKFHPSSKKTHTFKKNEPAVEPLTAILKTEAIDVPAWICQPMYRDAIVFYDEIGSIVSTLNICFSCEYMATKFFFDIHADVKTYTLLQHFFVELGHNIEDK